MKKAFAGFSFAVLLAVMASGQAASKGQPLPGLDATVTKVERAASASLRDCPPGSNTVTRAGEQFALVTVTFKVSPSFKAAPMKRPSVTDVAEKKYNTAATFVDV